MKANRLRVGLILLDKFTLTAFSGFTDALRLAADHGGRSRPIHTSWTVMSAGGASQRASCGVLVTPTGDLIAPSNFDYIAVCGGNSRTSTPEVILKYLRTAAKSRIPLIGICTGTFAIASAGLISKKACVHWNVADEFSERFPDLTACTDKIFIKEGNIITCAGSTAAIDVALHLIARHCGRDKALQAMRHMMLQDIRPASVPQAHFYSQLAGSDDTRVHQAAQFMEQRLDRPPSMASIARYIGVSRRQLERIFHTTLGIGPAKFQRTLRVRYANWLILHSTSPITKIALDCGFSDAAHLSRDFRDAYGLSPREYRARHASHKGS